MRVQCGSMRVATQWRLILEIIDAYTARVSKIAAIKNERRIKYDTVIKDIEKKRYDYEYFVE